MTWNYYNPVHIINSDSFELEVQKLTKVKRKILVLCSARFEKTEDFEHLNKHLDDLTSFTGIENNPSFESCQRAIDFAEDFSPDAIIAIGGGSVIDTAKSVRMAVYKSCFDIEKLFESNDTAAQKPLFIAVPTTHGASSEITMWATIWDKQNKIKHSLSEKLNYPDYAIYDAGLSISLPLSISISSTLDALSHSLEALWNNNSNPVSNDAAIRAIQLIMHNMDKIIEPISFEVRQNLLMASMYAGLAFSNTKTAAAHSISYPLTMHFDIPHGIACSMPLYALSKKNSECMGDTWCDIMKNIQMNDFDELWNRVRDLVKDRVPFSLREYGITKNDLKWLLDMTFSKDRMGNNIVDLNRDEVMQILSEIY